MRCWVECHLALSCLLVLCCSDWLPSCVLYKWSLCVPSIALIAVMLTAVLQNVRNK